MSRVLAISDIHGKFAELKDLLLKAKYDLDQDLLVVCGDMVDRGNENLKTLDYCLELQSKGAVILLGNHEVFWIRAIEEMLKNPNWAKKPSMFMNSWHYFWGGKTALAELQGLTENQLEKYLVFLKALPLYYETESFVFVHAGINYKKAIHAQKAKDCTEITADFYRKPVTCKKTVVFGHTFTKRLDYSEIDGLDPMIWHDPKYKDKIGIDCNDGPGGRLAILELPSRQGYYP